jgi:hypothetical protein
MFTVLLHVLIFLGFSNKFNGCLKSVKNKWKNEREKRNLKKSISKTQ